jgi:RHS repeat-associated protein
VVAETRYLPYGEERWASGGAVSDYTYTGQRAEAGFRLMDYNARYYDPRLGRFISADTLVPDPGNPQGLNRYSYVLNRPLQGGDPTGHQGPDEDQPWYAPLITAAGESWSWYDTHVNEPLRYYEVDRLVDNPLVQASLYSDPISSKCFTARIDTPLVTVEISPQVSGRFELGNSNGPRADQKRITLKAGQLGYYGDLTTGQVGLHSTSPVGQIETETGSVTGSAKAEVAALAVPPANVELAAAFKAKFDIEHQDYFRTSIEPGIKAHFTFHGGTTAALAGTALLVLGVVEAPTIVLPATGELLRRGMPVPTR